MATQEKSFFEKRIRDEENEFYRKRQIRDQIDQGKKNFLKLKYESRKMIEGQRRHNYISNLQEKNEKINKINEKAQQLEEVEKLLVEKLGMTQMNQH